MGISRTAIENKVWDVRISLMRKYGVDNADRMMYPLEWYIDTGRASTEFLRKFIESDPFKIADILETGRSVEGTVRKLNNHLMKGAK